jgi:hypothetical protein
MFILVVPFYLRFSYTTSDKNNLYSFLFYSITPYLFKAQFNTSSEKVCLFILGRKIGPKKDSTNKKDEENKDYQKMDTNSINPNVSVHDKKKSEIPESAEEYGEKFSDRFEDKKNGISENKEADNVDSGEEAVRYFEMDQGDGISDTSDNEKKVSESGDSAEAGAAQPDTKTEPSIEDETVLNNTSSADTPDAETEFLQKESNRLKRMIAKIRNTFHNLKKHPVYFFLSSEKLRQKLIRWGLQSFKRFFRIVQISRCEITVEAGFDDPSRAGKIFGYVEAFKGALGLNRKNMQIRYVPSFVHTSVNSYGTVQIKTSLGMITLPIFLAIVSFPYITSLVTVWKYHRFRKKDKVTK